MGEINVRCIFHRLHKIITGCSATVVTLKVQLHPFLEVSLTQQGVDHTNHFRTLLVHGQGIEVVHFDDHIRADRMRHRAGVLSKLQTAHGTHIADAVYRT